MNTSLATQTEDPIERTSILDVYQFATGLQATTHKQSGKYLVRCPVETHEDKNPSCYLNPKNDSWNCFACEGKGGKLKLVIAAGKARTNQAAAEFIKRCLGAERTLTFKEQPKLKDKHVRGEEELLDKREVAIHSYTDDKGRTYLEVIRFQGRPIKEGGRSKTFSQRLIGKDGKWIYEFTGQKFTSWPYRMKNVKKAAKEKKALIVMEGEIHCDCLDVLGIHATTLSGGWKSDWEPWWNEHLEGVPLALVIGDANPMGRRAAEKRADGMRGEGRKAYALDVFPDRENGDDLLNWMIEEGILRDYRSPDVPAPFNWRKMFLVPIDEARRRTTDKITECYKRALEAEGHGK